MKATLTALTRIEFVKLWHKKESYLYFVPALLPILYGVGFASGSASFTYRGDPMSHMTFIQTMFFMSHSLFIGYVFLIIVAARAVGSEIEDHSLLLYVPRVNDRAKPLAAKILAMLAFALVGVAAQALACVVGYYGLLVHSRIGSGAFAVGSDLPDAAAVVIESSLFLVVAVLIGVVLSLYTKTLVAVAAGTVALVVLTFASQLAPTAYLIPTFCLVRSIDIIHDAQPGATAGNPTIALFTDSLPVLVALTALVTAVWAVTLGLVAHRQFTTIDL